MCVARSHASRRTPAAGGSGAAPETSRGQRVVVAVVAEGQQSGQHRRVAQSAGHLDERRAATSARQRCR